ncbi:MAG: GNAT family protein [Pseudomonadota bacterium]
MKNVHTPTLTDQDLCLRPPIPTDVDGRIALGISDDIVRMFGGAPAGMRTIGRAQAEGWLEHLHSQPVSWVMTLAERVIGSLFFHTYWQSEARCSVAVGILDEALLGQGIGTRAMRLALGWGIDTLGLHRIELRVIDYNTRAQACYAKLGFVEEGRARQAALVDGQRHDDVIMGLLAPEFVRAGP